MFLTSLYFEKIHFKKKSESTTVLGTKLGQLLHNLPVKRQMIKQNE